MQNILLCFNCASALLSLWMIVFADKDSDARPVRFVFSVILIMNVLCIKGLL